MLRVPPTSRSLSLVCLLLVLAPAVLTGQTGAGSIEGVVKDASHAVIVGAKVTALHTGTNGQRETAANGAGFFAFPSLQPGSYRITVEAPGMQRWEGELVLQVRQTAVVEPILQVGGTATSVTVAGDVTPLVTTTNSTMGNVLERARVEQLPLNGRFFNELVFSTTPGIEAGSNNPDVYGLRGAMEFVQDGAVMANRDQGGITTRPPGIDTIEEFRVETNNSSAKLSRPATTIISTKSGTNVLHGSLFETHRNNGLGVARRRQDYYNKPPHLVRNEFGASAGGPVYIPKLYNGRNRTFFFFGYEAYRLLQSTTIATSVPTTAMNQGDFSALADAQGRTYTLYDPWSTGANWQRTPFAGNRIPANRESPMSKYMLDTTPAPTLTSVNPLVGNNYFAPGPNNRLDHTETARLDHRIGARDQLFVRFNNGRSLITFVGDSTWAPTTDGLQNVTYQPVQDNSGVANWTHIFSPTFFSETLVTGSQEDWTIQATGNPNLVDKLGLPIAIQGRPLATAVYNSGFGTTYYSDPGRENITRVMTFEQNFTKIHGRHEMQFGGRVRNERLHVLPDQPALYHFYNSQATSLYDPNTGSAYGAVPYTGFDGANFFLGIASRYSAEVIRSWFYFRQREYAVYFQDNFKVNSRLTLNFGLRHEMYPAISEKNNLISGFDVKSQSVVLGIGLDRMYKLDATTPKIVAGFENIGVNWTTASAAGLPDRLYNSSWWDFNPRGGFAYRLKTGKHGAVLRGAYGIYGYATYTRTFTSPQRTNPPVGTQISYNLQSAAQSPDGLPNYSLRSAPAIISGVNSRDIILNAATVPINRGGVQVWFFNPDQPTMRAHEWNLTLEREIMDNTVVRAAWVGTHGSRLDQYQYLNEQPNSYVWFSRTGQPLPTGAYSATAMRALNQTTYGSINMMSKIGWSNANAAQFEIERRYSKGYAFQLFYVMSNAARAGGNSRYDDFMQPTQNYLPGAVPDDLNARDRLLNYRRDTDIPKHRVRWNWIVDLPFGRGKVLGRNAGGFLERLIGGWQLAGSGSMRSNYWALPTGYWGELNKVEIYGEKYPVQDCRSGACYPGYLWYNGYIPANRINSYDAKTGKPNGVMGVPSTYQPAARPIFPTPADGGGPSDPNYPYYESNTAWVKLQNGTLQRTSLDTNYHPWRNQFLPGPRSWGLDASLFKAVRVTERTALRFNADFFNVLNMPGLVQPNSNSGIVSRQNSAAGPRQLQLTLRFTW